MHFSELDGINLWSLDDFDFSNSDVLDWIDGKDFLGDLLFNDVVSEKLQKLGGVGFGDFSGNDVIDSLSDFLLLGRKSIVGFSLLAG